MPCFVGQHLVSGGVAEGQTCGEVKVFNVLDQTCLYTVKCTPLVEVLALCGKRLVVAGGCADKSGPQAFIQVFE